MNEFLKLQRKIKEKSNNFDMSIFKGDDKVKSKLSDYCIDFKEQEKENFTFRLLTYKKKIPVKENSSHKLDYDFELTYALKIVINNNNDYLEMPIKQSIYLYDIQCTFLDMIEKIKTKETTDIFKYLIELIN